MAVLLDGHSSEQWRNSTMMLKKQMSVKVSIRKKCSNANTMVKMTLFFDNESDGPPDLATSSGDDEEDDQDRQDLIRESAEQIESNGYKRSRQRLAKFTKDQLIDR